MYVKLRKKFAEREVDEFISSIYSTYKKDPSTKFHFDFTDVEYIGNQELLVFSALLKTFVESGVDFVVEFFPRATPLDRVNSRVKKQIIQIWNIWRIWEIVPIERLIQTFGIDGGSVQRLINELGYYPKDQELYTRYGVTPFVPLQYVNNYREKEVQRTIEPIYSLNAVIEERLNKSNCHHPFTSNALSTIITEELYLNFLDHSTKSSFDGLMNWAAMSISFEDKLDESAVSPKDIQAIKGYNFSSESFAEARGFFYDGEKKRFKNVPYIQYSFVDFGLGIANTLREQSLKVTGAGDQIRDAEILRYAFRHDSSRHPINSPIVENKLIPRGLFDTLIIVKRYRGLLTVRSNYGKLLYDFSDDTQISNGTEFLLDSGFYFPGTLISVYIPAIEDQKGLNISTIKPEIDLKSLIKPSRKYLSFSEIYENVSLEKGELYNSLIHQIRNRFPKGLKASVVYFDFASSYNVERRILKKLLYFLLSDYEINNIHNVILMNFNHDQLVSDVSDELLELGSAIKNYKIHPLPITSYDSLKSEIKVVWLGIFDEADRIQLAQLLYEQHSLSKGDFNEVGNVSGHLMHFDSHGNLITNFPNRADLVDLYERQRLFMYNTEIKRIIEKHKSIWDGVDNTIFLCNGNYYQKKYIEVTDLLNDPIDSQIVSRLLFEKLKESSKGFADFGFIGVTTTSQKIFKSLELQGLLSAADYIVLDSYHAIGERGLDLVVSGKKYILICDVIATGSLTANLYNKLSELGAELSFVGVLVNTLTPELISSNPFIHGYRNNLISLLDYPIEKFSKDDIITELLEKKIIRINPYTNIPITLSIKETYFEESVIFGSSVSLDVVQNAIIVSNEFLQDIDDEDIQIGFLRFNNLIHPYFFDTAAILKNLNEKVVRKLFAKINKPTLEKEPVKVFYPRKSGIESFNIDTLKKVLGNHNIEHVEIERFGTSEGWRFPHNSNYAGTRVNDNICLILDDGSCSGDSLLQMIDEISFYMVKEIILVCFIGRIDDHKREFFSRISKLKTKGGCTVDTSIYFVSHWHLPTYYLDENPHMREKKWINDVVSLPNAPLSLKRIARNVSAEITPKDNANFTDYKYLPKISINGSLRFSKKDLLIVREELGKVIGFRLYCESFAYFDLFFKKYEGPAIRNSHYREMELLCATFIYEPYLYERLRSVLPDVANQVEAFVRSILFSDDDVFNKLHYSWNRKDIIHLFFVVFTDHKLVALLTKENFKSLVTFTHPKTSSLNYILYKLLYYFPLNPDELVTKTFDIRFKRLILELIEEDIPAWKEIKKYYNFVTSLPSREDYQSQLAYLRDNYIKQDGEELHDQKVSFGHNVSLIIANIRLIKNLLITSQPVSDKDWLSVRNAWLDMQLFILPILSFSKTFGGFLAPYPYFKLLKRFETGENSIRELVGFNDQVIFSPSENIKETEKLEKVIANVSQIQTDLDVNSEFHHLVGKPTCCLQEFITTLCSDLVAQGKDLLEDINLGDQTLSTNVPYEYMKILLQKELVNNIKNHSSNADGCKIEVYARLIMDGTVEIVLKNQISMSSFEKSNGEGIKCLQLLAEFQDFGFEYLFKSENGIFIQEMKFITV